MDGSAHLLSTGSSIGPGDVVLDLVCGTGPVGRHVADVVGRDGRVVGADINPAMLEVARERSPSTIEWVVAPARSLPFDDGTFTHVICQQGLQFFPDPVAATSEAQRVLRSGGSFVAIVWATPGHNPHIEHQLGLLAEQDPAVVDSARGRDLRT